MSEGGKWRTGNGGPEYAGPTTRMENAGPNN